MMKEALGYPFYEFDEQQVPLELDPAYGEEFTRKYNLKLAKLAYDIAGLIKKIESAPATASKPAEAPRCGDIQTCNLSCGVQFRSSQRARGPGVGVAASWISSISRHPAAEVGRRIHRGGGRIPGSMRSCPFTWWAQNTASFLTDPARSR